MNVFLQDSSCDILCRTEYHYGPTYWEERCLNVANAERTLKIFRLGAEVSRVILMLYG